MEVVILEVTKDENYESVFVKWCLGPLFLNELIEIIALVLLNRVSVDKHSADLRGDQSAQGLLLMTLEALLADDQILWDSCAAWKRDVALDIDLWCL